MYGICNVVGASIPRNTDSGTYIHVGPEIGVASTKAFTGQVTVLMLLALCVGQMRGTVDDATVERIVRELKNMPLYIKDVLGLADKIKNLSKIYTYARNFLYLGRGYNYPTALEGALKLKEISYIHAEGYPAAEMKRFKSNSKRKLYISLYRNDYGFAVSIGLDCKVMKKLWHGMKWGHMKHWDDGIYYGVASLVVKQKIKNPSFDTVLDENRKEFLKKQWQEAIKHNNFTNASNSLTGGISNQWNPEYNHSKQENKFIIPYISVIDDFFGTTNISKKIEDALIRQGANFLKSYVNSHKTQSTQLVCISQREKTAYSLFRNDLSWNGGGYRVKETFLRYYRNIVFSIKIKGDKTTPGADLGDNDFVGKPEIVSCEAIVYTKDGDGWIGAKIEKK